MILTLSAFVVVAESDPAALLHNTVPVCITSNVYAVLVSSCPAGTVTDTPLTVDVHTMEVPCFILNVVETYVSLAPTGVNAGAVKVGFIGTIFGYPDIDIVGVSIYAAPVVIVAVLTTVVNDGEFLS